MGFSLIALSAIGIAAALISFSVMASVARKTTVSGFLAPAAGALRIVSPHSGQIAELMCSDGDRVSLGQPLIRLRVERITSQGDTSQQVVEALRARQKSLVQERALKDWAFGERLSAIQTRITLLEAERVRVSSEAELAERREKLSKQKYERTIRLAASGFLSDSQVEQHLDEIAEAEARILMARKSALAIDREIQSIGAERTSAQAQYRTEQLQLDRAIDLLQQEAAENRSREEAVITAPSAGTISSALRIGQAVNSGEPLLTVLASNSESADVRLDAQLYAISKAIGFVRVGQRAWLRYPMFPFQKFGMASGTVIAVGQAPISQHELPAGYSAALTMAARTNEPLYRIDVRLDAQHHATYSEVHALKSGMAVEADIVHERRAIWEWVFEPLLAAAAKGKILGGRSEAIDNGPTIEVRMPSTNRQQSGKETQK